MTIDLSYLNYLYDFILYAPPKDVYLFLFKNGGWLILCLLTYKMFLPVYQVTRNCVWLRSLKWIFLAVDIPKGNEQTPKAVEQIFAQLAGAHKDPDLENLFLDGYIQPWFSLEIVSIEGYIQFIIGVVDKYRDTAEAAIYAQYPDAEITQIEDYAKNFPSYFPNKDYQLWGTEYVLTNEIQYFPIRTYKEFEHDIAEEVFKDPLAALLEAFGRMGKGEFAGMQYLIKPISHRWQNWREKGLDYVKKMIGARKEQKETVLSKAGSVPGKVFDTAMQAVLGGAAEEKREKKEEPYSLMLHLPPGYKADVEMVERKISKICFASKIRFIYLAKKEVYNKNRAAYGVTGAMKQYITLNLNGLKPEFETVGTHVHYFFRESRLNWRRTRLVNAFKTRSRWRGVAEYLLNIEELASLWHFPMLYVKAPAVSMIEARRGQPPTSLPAVSETGDFRPIEKQVKGVPPPDLPV